MKTLILGSHDEWVPEYYILARVYLWIAHTVFSVGSRSLLLLVIGRI